MWKSKKISSLRSRLQRYANTSASKVKERMHTSNNHKASLAAISSVNTSTSINFNGREHLPRTAASRWRPPTCTPGRHHRPRRSAAPGTLRQRRRPCVSSAAPAKHMRQTHEDVSRRGRQAYTVVGVLRLEKFAIRASVHLHIFW